MRGVWLFLQLIAFGSLILFSEKAIADGVDSLIKQRRDFTAQRDELVRDFFRSVEVADNSRASAVKNYLDAAQSAQTMIEILIQPNILKRLKPSTYAKILLSGVKTGIELGNAVNDQGFARAIEESALETAKLALRYTEKIHAIDMQISNLYTEQAKAQVTLMIEAQSAVEYEQGAGYGEAQSGSGISCVPLGFRKPIIVDCPEVGVMLCPILPPSEWGKKQNCYIEGDADFSEQGSQSLLNDLDELKSQKLGMDDDFAQRVVSFCESNPLALQCLPASKTARLGAFCEGPNPLPDCAPNQMSRGKASERLGAYCEGQDPQSDCIR